MSKASQIAIDHAFAAFRQNPTFQSLDGLRCISIVAVVWHHSLTTTENWHLLNLGFLGVDLFFVISGFLIVTLLLRERLVTGTVSLQMFYIRRTLRIFPLYYGLILGMAAIYRTIDSHSLFGQQFIRDIPYYLTYTANFVPVGYGIVWSLATEEQFYLVWPSIEKYLGRHVIPILIVTIILNQLVNLTTGKQIISAAIHSSDWTGLLISQTTFTPILLGVCGAHVLHEPLSFRYAGRLVGSIWSPAIYITVLIAAMAAMPPDISGSPRFLLQVCMVLLLMSCVYQENHVLRPLLTLYPIREVGKISYGIYLLHILVIAAVVHLIGARLHERVILTFVLDLTATVLLAELSFRLCESPILRFKKRFATTRTQAVHARIRVAAPSPLSTEER